MFLIIITIIIIGIIMNNFRLKLFDITVTLKYGQGNWKWYEQVKLNE